MISGDFIKNGGRQQNMSLKDKLQKEKPWAAIGWTRKQWKRSKMWKKAGVSEEKMAQFIAALDQETITELKGHATAEALVENMFGEANE